ncbi:MAG: molybdopterin molybdotransferase [Maribacter sp.]|jgi:molybdopterin molybdotransferase
MITVAEADKFISDNIFKVSSEKILFSSSLGRILDEDIVADRDFPPFDRVTMDGIAINYISFSKGVKGYPIEGIVPAGSPLIELKNIDSCLEVMTGAILPTHTDMVIQYEKIDIKDGIATINPTTDFKQGASIHKKGRDCSSETLLIPKGSKITAVEISILATVGKPEVRVKSLPKIAVIATGDELVEVNEVPLLHQIRSSNVHMLQARLTEMGLDSTIFHLKDDKDILQQKIESILLEFDVLVLSGGVSKGKFDFVPEVLNELGVQKIFHKIRQKPGKPFWFGKKENTFVFALPGNPISSFMCLNRYFKTWFQQSMKLPKKTYFAKLAADYSFNKNLTYFLQVSTSLNEKGQLEVTPNQGNGSGDLANFIHSDGFLELPMNQNDFKKGDVLSYHPFKTI